MRNILPALVLLWLTPALVSADDDFDQAPILYRETKPDNVISRLQQRLDDGKSKMKRDREFGYLRALLRELDVPTSSQTLVFSKTSLQRHRITPRTPRALYFSDDVYIGYCQDGEVLEISAVDPALGTVFYTLHQDQEARPRFVRQTDNCLICHASSQTRQVPGHVLRSVFPDPSGQPILASGSYRIDHSSPLSQRWGGWYVTGSHGDQTHLGNLIVRDKRVQEPVANQAGMNVTSLADRINSTEYLTAHSDLVALMVLEHQAEGHNRITRANFLTRQALHYETTLNRALNKPATERWDSTISRIKGAGEPLVRYLLFSDEAKLTSPLSGTTTFAEEFVKAGPRDGEGRSLRDFDLQRRLFRYPCSYLIYSEAFDALPGEVKDYVWRRLWDVLTGRDTTKEFAHLTPADRQGILAILQATKPGLPDYWSAKGGE